MTRTTGPSTVGAIRRLAADERGSTAIEYALICGLIFLVIVGSVRTLGESVLANLFQVVADSVKTTPPPRP